MTEPGNPRKGYAMLVLSRMLDEVIMIGDDIQVIIVDIRGDKVRIAVCAPASVPVHRKEVYDAIKAEEKRLEAEERPAAKSTRRSPVEPPKGPKRPERGS
jgi:carbon storage regulator